MECCVDPDVPVTVIVYVVERGPVVLLPPLLPPPQAAWNITAADNMPPNRQTVSLLLVEQLEPKPAPIKAKPATGSHRNWSGRESRTGEGATSEAVAVPVLMVSIAVAFPLASKVTEFGSSEHIGADCVGCTEQASATGLSNAFSELSVTVEVEL